MKKINITEEQNKIHKERLAMHKLKKQCTNIDVLVITNYTVSNATLRKRKCTGQIKDAYECNRNNH